MKPLMWMTGATAAGLLAALVTIPAPAEEAAPAAVHIGLVKTLFRDVPDLLVPVGLRQMKALIESQTGVPGELVPAGDADQLARQMDDGELQLGVFHGIEFAWIHSKYPKLKPLVIAVDKRPCLRAHLIVRADSKITSGASLEGKVVALPRMSREHCRLFLERRLCPEGREPAAFFGQVTTPFDVEDALDDVVDDKAQASVIDETAFEAYRKSKPGRAAKLKSAVQSEPFPCAVIAYEDGAVADRTLEVFREGLIGAKDNPKAQLQLKMNHITGFEPVPADYSQQLEDIAKAYPPPNEK